MGQIIILDNQLRTNCNKTEYQMVPNYLSKGRMALDLKVIIYDYLGVILHVNTQVIRTCLFKQVIIQN